MKPTPGLHIGENLPVYSNITMGDISQGDYAQYGFKKPQGNVLFHIGITSAQQDTPEVWQAVSDFASREGLPVKVTAGRSNILVTEQDLNLIHVSYRRDGKYESSPHLKRDRNGRIECPAAVPLGHFVHTMAMRYERRDIANLTGIPGTLGAAILGNSGRTVSRHNIGDNVQSVRVFDLKEGKEEVFDLSEEYNRETFFGPRSSYLRRLNEISTRYVVRSAVFSMGTNRDPGARELYFERFVEREGPNGKNAEGVGTAGSTWINSAVPTELKADLVQSLGLHPEKPLLVRTLLQRATLPNGDRLVDLNVNGARYTGDHVFLTTGPQTSDANVAEVLATTVETIQHNFGFTPVPEIDILGPNGSETAREFIARHSSGSGSPDGTDRLLCNL